MGTNHLELVWVQSTKSFWGDKLLGMSVGFQPQNALPSRNTAKFTKYSKTKGVIVMDGPYSAVFHGIVAVVQSCIMDGRLCLGAVRIQRDYINWIVGVGLISTR